MLCVSFQRTKPHFLCHWYHVCIYILWYILSYKVVRNDISLHKRKHDVYIYVYKVLEFTVLYPQISLMIKIQSQTMLLKWLTSYYVYDEFVLSVVNYCLYISKCLHCRHICWFTNSYFTVCKYVYCPFSYQVNEHSWNSWLVTGNKTTSSKNMADACTCEMECFGHQRSKNVPVHTVFIQLVES